MARLVLVDQDYNSVARPINVPAPTADHHAANKAYVDSAVEGIAWKDSARVSTQGNIDLASPGSTIDAITMATGDRVLVRAQTTGSQNGIYVWNGAATPMTRAADASTAAELEQATLTVEEGTDAGTTWRQSEINFTLGSGNVTFGAFGGSTPDASESTKGKIEIATQAETDTGTDDTRAMTPAKAKAASWRVKKYATDFGDGSATSFTITHNLGTRDVVVSIHRNSGNYDEVLADVEKSTANTVTIKTAVAPTSNQFRCTVIG